jgi:predicted ester cyclase
VALARSVSRLALTVICFVALSYPMVAQSGPAASAEEKHAYTKYEQLVYDNVTQFHKNFDNHEWNKNGVLVADDLRVNSNGTELHGRDEFINRIARFAGPFPDVKITDLDTIVDGNKAAIRFVITGTQMGDLTTPNGVLHATNRKIKVDGIEYFTFNPEGKLVELLTVEDLAGMMRQLTAPGQ